MNVISLKLKFAILLLLSTFTALSAHADSDYLEPENLRECLVFIYNGDMPNSLQDMYAFIRTNAYRFELNLYGTPQAGKSYYEANLPNTDLYIQIDAQVVHTPSSTNLNTRILKSTNGEKQKLFEYASPIWDYSFGFDSYSGSYINYAVDMKQPLMKSRTGQDYYQRMSIKCYLNLSNEDAD